MVTTIVEKEFCKYCKQMIGFCACRKSMLKSYTTKEKAELFHELYPSWIATDENEELILCNQMINADYELNFDFKEFCRGFLKSFEFL